MASRKPPERRTAAKTIKTPASGERAAALGFFAQYEVAAGLLLRALTQEAPLTWLALMDDEAGRLDDFQMATSDRLDAYQVKWSETGGQMPWSELQGYLTDLLNDRREIAARHPDLAVSGHLYCDRVPSRGRIGAAPKDDKGPYSCAGAVKELLQPAIEQRFAALEDIPDRWRWLWDRVARTADLTAAELLGEMPQLRLEFGQQLPKRLEIPGQDKARFDRDIDDLFVVLTDIPREPRRLVRLTREELLVRLPSEWRRRLDLASVHEFPRPRAYEPIKSSTDELRAAIEEHTRGYVALVGAPGAGKSTLLSEELKQRADVVARYYAYVPSRGEVGPQRAEAANFLHDLVLTLERSGLPRGPGPVDFDLAHLAERFRRLLAQLGDRFAHDGERSLVMIDGLDHVERADPTISLFTHLPAPADVPDGVLFVVGSQTVRMLDEQIVTQLAEPRRTVEMRGLDSGAVARLAEAAGVQVDPGELMRVTDGHPLLLDYFFKQLSGLTAADQATALADLEPLGGDVRALYDRLWTGGIRDDPELVELLALVSRIRTAIDLQWLRDQGQSGPVVRKLQDRFAHLFRRDDTRWYFFHDSFRVYLQEKTGTSGQGARYHRQLAEMCTGTASGDAMRWEVIFHLASADAHEEVLATATPDFFREQLFALRPPTLIAGDIALAGRSLAVRQDPMALVRLAMAAYELNQRSYQEPDRKKFLELLLWLGRWRSVVDLLEVERDDMGSEDPRELSLEMATALWLHGHQEEARQLLAANEPYDLLRGQRRTRPYREPEELLYAWAQAAVLVYGASPVLEAANKLDLTGINRLGGKRDEDVTPSVRGWMLAMAAAQADVAGLTEEAARVRDGLDLADATQRSAWAQTQLWRVEDDEQALEELLTLRPEELSPGQRVWVAALLCERNALQQAAEWISGLQQPAPARAGTLDPWDAEAYRYQLTYVQAALGHEVKPVEITSDTRSERAAAQIARAVVAMAKLRAHALVGAALEPEDLLGQLRNALALLEPTTVEDPIERYPLRQAHPGALATAVRVAETQGEAHVRAVWAYLRQRWADHPQHLLAEGDRVLPRVAASRAVAPGDLREVLDELAQAAREHSEPSERARDLVDIARTCLALGDFNRGEALLEEAVRSTLAIYPDKDLQLTSWIELLRPRLDQEDGAQMVGWLAGVLADLGGAPADDAAQQLLADEARRRPSWAWSVGRWLAEQDVIDWDDRLLGLLRGADEQARDELWWIVLTDCYLPVGRGRRYGLLQKAASIGLAAKGSEWVARQLKRLAWRLEVDAPPGERDHWRWELADAAADCGLEMKQVGLPDRLHPQKRPPRSRRRGTGEEEHDAYLAATDTPEKVLAALRAGERSVSEPLDEALERVAPHLTKQQLRELASLDDQLLETDHVLTLVETARRLGELGLAQELIERGLRRSNASGWRRMWDGGTLLKLMVANWELDPQGGRHRAYVRFAADAATDRWLLSGVADDLKHYMELFGIDDRLAVAEEVEIYVRRLVEEPNEVPPETEQEEHDPLTVLGEAVIGLLASPYRLGISAGQQALLAAVEAAQTQALSEIARRLQGGDDELVLRVFSVLEAHISCGRRLGDEMLAHIERWAASEHLTIRLAAQRLLRAHGRDLPPIPRRALPPELRSPIAPEHGGEWPDEPEFIEDDSASEFLRSMRPRVHRVANIASVDQDLFGDYVVERAVADSGGELPDDAALQTDRGVLGWTFFPPSVVLWDHASARAASLLVDAQRLPPGVALLGTTGPLYDPDLIAVRPAPQPPELASALAGHDDRWVAEESWLAAIESAQQRLMSTYDGWIVVGEYTDVRYLDREMPREQRWQCLSGQGDEEVKARPPLWSSCLLSDVKQAEVPGSDYPLTAQRDLNFRGPGTWFALNPFVAAACGWTPADSELLAYQDEQGVVAKSLWWRNGWPDSSNWASHDEIGEGWLVLVAPRALTVLEEALGEPLDISWRVERDFMVAGKSSTAEDSGRRLLPET